MNEVYKSIVANVAWFARQQKIWSEDAFKNWKIAHKDLAKELSEKYKDFDVSEVSDLVTKNIVAAHQSNGLTKDHRSILKNYATQPIFFGNTTLEELYEIYFAEEKDNGQGNGTKVNQTMQVTNIPQSAALNHVNYQPSLQTLAMNSMEYLTDEVEDVEDWFKNYERITEANGWPKEEQGRRLSLWLKDKALNIWSDMDPVERINYDKIKESIINKISQDNEVTNLREFFNRVQKPSESVGEFSTSVKKAFGRAFQNNKEKEPKILIERFRTGLLPEIQASIIGSKLDEFEQIVKLAGEVEKILSLKKDQYRINAIRDRNQDYQGNETRQFRRNSDSRSRSPSPRRYETEQEKEKKSHYQERDKSKTRNNKNFNHRNQDTSFRCYNCNKPGHIARNCFYKRAYNSYQNHKQETRHHKNWISPVLINGELNQRKKFSSTHIRIKINNCKTMALVDSGAAKTLVSTKFAKKMKLKTTKAVSNTKWVTANGSELENNGETVINLEIGTYSIEQRCTVIKNLVTDVLIGTDLLSNHGILINYQTKEFIFKNVKIPLITSSEDPKSKNANTFLALEKLSTEEISNEFSNEEMKKAQESDPALVKIKGHISKSNNEDNRIILDTKGIMYKAKTIKEKKINRVMIPKSLVETILKKCHQDANENHLGFKKTWLSVREKYFWKTMYEDTKEWTTSCDKCTERRTNQLTKQEEIKKIKQEKNAESERLAIKDGFKEKTQSERVKNQDEEQIATEPKKRKENEAKERNILKEQRSKNTKNNRRRKERQRHLDWRCEESALGRRIRAASSKNFG